MSHNETIGCDEGMHFCTEGRDRNESHNATTAELNHRNSYM